MQDDGDDAFNADQPFDATVKEMIGVPVRSREDALTAIDWLIQEGRHNMIELSDDGLPADLVSHSLVHAVRDYLASTVA